MPSKPRLALRQSPRVAVFRYVDQLLRSNETLRNVVGAWRSWEGDAGDDSLPLAQNAKASVRLTPSSGPQDFWAVNSMSSDLLITVEMLIPSTCYDDADNLWHAIERALFPVAIGEHNAIILKLQQLGARKGIAVAFRPPGAPVRAEENGAVCFRALGQIKIEVHTDINV